MHSHYSDPLDYQNSPHYRQSQNERELVRQRFMSLNPSINVHCHSFDKACTLFQENKLSADQVSRFSRSQFDALHSGFLPSQVDMPGFSDAHLTALRMGLKPIYLHPRITWVHVEAIQRYLEWNKIINLTSQEVLDLTANLSRSQSWALRRFDLERNQVDHTWFNKITLRNLYVMSYEEAATISKNKSIIIPRLKNELVANYHISYKEAQTWLKLPSGLKYWFMMQANNVKSCPVETLLLIVGCTHPNAMSVLRKIFTIIHNLPVERIEQQAIAQQLYIRTTRLGLFSSSPKPLIIEEEKESEQLDEARSPQI